MVLVNCAEESMNVRTMLIFPLRGICIQSVYSEGIKHSYTQKEGELRKLPVGDKGVVAVLASRGEETYFASKTITIPETGIVEVELEATTMEAIKEQLTNAIQKQKNL